VARVKFTILGSTGFIGRRMVQHMQERGDTVETPPRDASHLRGRNLGHVIYAIGLTGNFRTQPQAAIRAHVQVLENLIEGADFESWLYLSGTRVYGGLPHDAPASEDAALPVRPGLDAGYDLSKLLGESLCLAMDRSTVRVARLSNVYGVGQSIHSFLGSVVHDLSREGKVLIGEAPESSKDYVSVETVAAMLRSIATGGKYRVYNVASGHPVSHRALADVIKDSGYNVEFRPDGPVRAFPPIDTRRITNEFGGICDSILEDLPLVIKQNARYFTRGS
jgi:nucleoside-diphosphate-sugar epimerase